jgi:glutathione S-transferase
MRAVAIPTSLLQPPTRVGACFRAVPRHLHRRVPACGSPSFSLPRNTAMSYVHLVTILAIVQFIFFGVQVGRARGRYGIKAPATSGDEGFERIYRVQMNTLEQLIGFLPALYIAATTWSPTWAAGLGAIYLVGRMLYWVSYVREPATRTLGYVLSALPTVLLLLLGAIGAVRTLL